MPSDAKLGLVVGIVLVLAVAVVFFRKDGKTATPDAVQAVGAAVGDNPTAAISDFLTRLMGNDSQAAGSQKTPVNELPAPVTHEIKDGDTLFSIAEKYYGEGDRFHELYKANKDVIKNPDSLPVGKQIRIPG